MLVAHLHRTHEAHQRRGVTRRGGSVTRVRVIPSRSPRGTLVATLLSLATIALLLLAPRPARAAEALKIAVPEKDNLQYLVFRVAWAAELFAQEGVAVDVVFPPAVNRTESLLEHMQVEAAVLTPPMFLRLVAGKKPVVLVANLQQNDMSSLVATKDAADARKLGAEVPLRERVGHLRGATIGVSPQQPARLRAMLASQGLDPEKDVTIKVLLARDLGAELEKKKVDAIWAGSPFLERALDHDGAVTVIDGLGGEVKELAIPQVIVLGVVNEVLEKRRPVIEAAVRALAAAAKMIHDAPAQAAAALARAFPDRPRGEIDAALKATKAAIPASLEIHADRLAPALELIPENVPRPSLDGVALAPFVAPAIGRVASRTGAAPESRSGTWFFAAGMGILTVGILVFAMARSRREKAEKAALKKAS